jgi:tripartite ATP-independent transporter DctM subunit
VSDVLIGAIGFAAMIGALALRIPIGISMIAVGMAGYAILTDFETLLDYLNAQAYWTFSTADFSVLPLFVLMGHFAARAGLSQALFRAAAVWLGHFRGGMAMAAIGGCAGFGAISGSSLACAATMGQVALPELRRYKYSGSLATGTLAAGGTLGILIPPSVVLIIYAILVEGSIAELFQAAFLPGILAALGYIAAIAVVVRLRPEAGPAGPRASARERWEAIVEIWPVLVIFLLVIGGIYVGVFTATEGAAVGCVGTFLIALARGGMSMNAFLDSLIETGITTGLIFLILLGATIFNAFLGFSQMPLEAVKLFQESGLSGMTILLAMIVLYLFLGCIMDSISMILLTTPIFWPIIAGFDFGLAPDDLKLWFGIITLIVVEVGLITPPVGLNVYVINGMARDVPMIETFRGVLPFLASDALRIALIVLAPAVVLVLPHLLAR